MKGVVKVMATMVVLKMVMVVVSMQLMDPQTMKHIKH